jgi:hypothetical protein
MIELRNGETSRHHQGSQLTCARSLQPPHLRRWLLPPRPHPPMIIPGACKAGSTACRACVNSPAISNARPRPPGLFRIAAPTRALHSDCSSHSAGVPIRDGKALRPAQGMTTMSGATSRRDGDYVNDASTLPSPASSITTSSPALSHTVLTRLPVSTISPARRPFAPAAR